MKARLRSAVWVFCVILLFSSCPLSYGAPFTVTTADNVQAIIDAAPDGAELVFAPGDYSSKGKIRITRSNLTLRAAERRTAVFTNIQIGSEGSTPLLVKNIRIEGLRVRDGQGTGISMNSRMNNGRYQQENITIADCEVSHCGAGFGAVGHGVTLIDCEAHTLLEKSGSDDCDGIRAWGERISIIGFTMNGADSRFVDAHADFLQCWVLSRTNNADGYLRDLLIEDCYVNGGPKGRTRGVHQGIILECDAGQIEDVTVKNSTFISCSSYAIGFKGATGIVSDCVITDSASGKAEWSWATLTSVRNTTNGTPTKFDEVSGGKVIYLTSLPTDPAPEPTPTPNVLPFTLTASTPEVSVTLDVSIPENVASARLVLDVTDADQMHEADLLIVTPFGSTTTLPLFEVANVADLSANDEQRSVEYIPLDPLMISNGVNLFTFRHYATQYVTIHNASVEFTLAEVEPEPIPPAETYLTQEDLDAFRIEMLSHIGAEIRRAFEAGASSVSEP